MKESTMTHRTNILLDDEQVIKLDSLARKRGISRSSLIRHAVNKEITQAEESTNWRESLFALQGMYDESLSLNDMRANDDKRQKRIWS